MATTTGQEFEPAIQEAVDQIGQLLIRGGAVFGALTTEQQVVLRQATDASLPDLLVFAIETVARHSAQTKESLRRHPPAGLDLTHLNAFLAKA